jgi:hypothetical protein
VPEEDFFDLQSGYLLASGLEDVDRDAGFDSGPSITAVSPVRNQPSSVKAAGCPRVAPNSRKR